MKKISILIVGLLFMVSCELSKENVAKNLGKTSIKIEDPSRHYYPIPRGAKLYLSYKIINTGKNPLLIKNVFTSCGCIKVNFPKYTINPNKTGYINLEYDSSKNIGFVTSYIDIYANLDSIFKKTITFDVNVVTNALYTKDYEEIFKEKQESAELGVEGSETQQGYFVDINDPLKR